MAFVHNAQPTQSQQMSITDTEKGAKDLSMLNRIFMKNTFAN